MMKAIQFIPDILQLTRKISCQILFRFEWATQFAQRVQHQKAFSFLINASQNIADLNIKGALVYLTRAFGEGVKQNFLGPNVDTEFVVLTARVYAEAIAKLIAHHPILTTIKLFIK